MTHLSELQEQKKIIEDVINNAEKVNRLFNNSDFKNIILTGFCTDEMKRCMSLAVAENVDASLRDLGNQMAKASSVLEKYLNLQKQYGEIAKNDLEEINKEIEEILTKGESEE